jgi:hypothetical protein
VAIALPSTYSVIVPVAASRTPARWVQTFVGVTGAERA